MFTESLTVRILGDSSGLRTELEAAADQLDKFEQRLGALSDVGERLASGFGGLTAAAPPLGQVSQLLTGILQRLTAIGQTPLTINVQPALAALLQLSAAIEAVAARLRAVTLTPPKASAPIALSPGAASPTPALPGPPAAALLPMPQPAPYLASASSSAPVTRASAALAPSLPADAAVASLSLAPATTWREPRSLAPPWPRIAEPQHPQFERSRPQVAPPQDPPAVPSPRELPASLPATTSEPQAPRSPPQTPVSTTTNHFGGITIQVRETADVNSLVRDLRLQGIHLRNRRG